MKDKTRRQLLYGAAAFLWMILIFALSARTADLSDKDSGLFAQLAVRILCPEYGGWDTARQLAVLSAADRVIRKSAHFAEYFILCVLYYKTLEPSVRKAPSFAPVFAILYAITDELHQYFVPGRAAMAKDVLIDGAGAVLAAVVILLIRKRRKRISSERK